MRVEIVRQLNKTEGANDKQFGLYQVKVLGLPPQSVQRASNYQYAEQQSSQDTAPCESRMTACATVHSVNLYSHASL